MAGSYMDAPAPRLAYDRDGSIGVTFTSTGVLTQLSQDEMRAINGESELAVTLSSSQNRLAVVFPVPTDIAAIFLSVSFASPTLIVETSKDTTTGLDGTWTTQITARSFARDVKPNYRVLSALHEFSAGTLSQGVRGIRITASTTTIPSIRSIHLYGAVSTAAVDRIAMWHPTLDIPLPAAHLDWGNVARSSSETRSFRVKNLSTSLTATDIVLAIESLTPGAPSVGAMHTISENEGASFHPSVTLDALLPGNASPILQVRRTVPDSAQVSLWSARVVADVTTWTD